MLVISTEMSDLLNGAARAVISAPMVQFEAAGKDDKVNQGQRSGLRVVSGYRGCKRVCLADQRTALVAVYARSCGWFDMPEFVRALAVDAREETSWFSVVWRPCGPTLDMYHVRCCILSLS